MKCGSCDKLMRKSFKADGFRICGGCERKLAEEAKRAKLNPKIEESFGKKAVRSKDGFIM